MTATILDTPPPSTLRREPSYGPIPTSRLTAVELRKMFDTRSGFWLLCSIAITALLATVGVIAFAPENALTYDTFAAAIGFPMAFILPIIAALAVTGEWSQRSGLTTFTLVPHRGRVLGAKALAALAVAVASMALAFAIGALGNVIGAGINGTGLVWDISPTQVATIVLGNILGMASGFMLGVLIRNSAGAVVAYFGYTVVMAGILSVLAELQSWFANLQGWVDFNYAQGPLFSGEMTGTAWANVATTSALWLVLPLAVGLLFVRRSEVK